MIKNIALFLASSTLACVLPVSTFTAPKIGGYEALTAERSIGDLEYYDGYNFFGDCIVESTTTYIVENYGILEETIEFDAVSRVSFGNWYPQWVSGYFDTDGFVSTGGLYSGNQYTVFWDILTSNLGSINIDGNSLRSYSRDFTCFGEYDIDGDTYEDFRPYKWRVYQPTPIIVPYVFLEQFLLGLSVPTHGVEVSSFKGDLYIYNLNDNYFDWRSVSLRGDGEIGGNLQNSISPSALRSIFYTTDNRYMYYANPSDYVYDYLSYNGGWVFCKFDLTWTLAGFEHADDESYFYYSNQYASEGVFDLFNETYPDNIALDTQRLWSVFHGDIVYAEPINPPDIIFGTVEGFLATEFIPDFSFGDLLLIVLGVMVFGAFLKVFLGG